MLAGAAFLLIASRAVLTHVLLRVVMNIALGVAIFALLHVISARGLVLLNLVIAFGLGSLGVLLLAVAAAAVSTFVTSAFFARHDHTPDQMITVRKPTIERILAMAVNEIRACDFPSPFQQEVMSPSILGDISAATPLNVQNDRPSRARTGACLKARPEADLELFDKLKHDLMAA